MNPTPSQIGCGQPILLVWPDPWSTWCYMYVNCFKGLTFGILNKKFQEKTSLSTVFCLSIDKISSKRNRETTVSQFISILLT